MSLAAANQNPRYDPCGQFTYAQSYSLSQMDDFYQAISDGVVKPSGVMNLMQHLYVAERCPSDSTVLDLCCGRALLIPLLKTYAPTIRRYLGVDISMANLREAEATLRRGDDRRCRFPCTFVLADVTELPFAADFTCDVIVYTSSLEHLERSAGMKSLEEVARVLSRDGTLYLSTPQTPEETPRRLQYKVHKYEWDRAELETVLHDANLTITDIIGLLPHPHDGTRRELENRFGVSAAEWYDALRTIVPYSLLAPVVATCVPDTSIELLYVCKKGA